MAHTVVGVDLGARGIKVVELAAGLKRRIEVVRYHERPLPEGEAPYEERAADALAALLAASGLAPDFVFLALPGDALVLRALHLPFRDPKKIEQVLGYELESQLLSRVEDLVVDHVVAPAGARDGAGARVLVAAAARDRLGALLGAMSARGIEARGVTAAPLAYAALDAAGLLATGPVADAGAGPTAIVDVGRDRTNVCVIAAGRPVFARTIAHGGEEVTRALAAAFGIPPAQAEVGKLEEGFVESGGHLADTPARRRLADAVAAGIAPLVRGLRQTFVAAQAEVGERVGEVLTCGGGAELRGLADHLASALGVPVAPLRLDLAAGTASVSVGADGGRGAALALAVGVGGALGASPIELRRGPFAFRADLSFLRGKALSVALSVMAVLALSAVNGYAALFKLRREEASLAARLRTESTSVFGEPRSAEEIAGLLATSAKKETLALPTMTAFDVLAEISRRAPGSDRVKLDVLQLEIKPRRTFVKGTTDRAEAVDELAAALKEIECFSAVQKGKVTSSSNGERQFTLTFDTTCP